MSLYAVLLVSLITMAASLDENVLQVALGNNQFTFEILRELRNDKPTENIFCSPLSVSVAVGMAYVGSSGDTRNDIQTKMHYPEKDETFLAGYQTLLNSNKDVKDVILNMANRMYIQKDFKILEDFQTKVTNNFLAPVECLDFVDNVESAKKINTWVEDQTNKRIKDLISPDLLNSFTRLVLVNAIYFKGNWVHKFDPLLNQKMDFYLDETNKVSGVDFMRQTKTLPYADLDNINAQVLALPYVGGRLEMIIILPKDKTGLSDTLDKLVTNYGNDFAALREKLTSFQQIQVAIPKFKLDTSMSLKHYLDKLGMGVMFNQEKADFSGIDGAKDLYVSAVVQKAFIEVNEEGSEAAAATGVVMMMRSMPGPKPIPPKFTADRPFLYLIGDVDSSNILFIGVLNEAIPSS